MWRTSNRCVQDKPKRLFQECQLNERDENYTPTKIINTKDSPQKGMWKEHFQVLHNPSIMTDHSYEAKDHDILES